MRMDDRFEICREDPLYPARLLDLEDAPPRLYGRGDPAALDGAALSIIGARKATPYGLAGARLGAQIAVSLQVTVVSGGAIGCDQAAGKEALERGGKTVAVLGCGADVVYPQNARAFYEGIIASGGALVSEQPWKTRPLRWTFPRRNRIIAALGDALLVTEAGLPSGSATTAAAAADLGREILAIPGSIFSANSRGCNKLIEEGATPIWDRTGLEIALQRVFSTLALAYPDKVGTRACIDEPVLQTLVSQSARPADIAEWLALDVSEVLRVLSAYEIEGTVVKLRDGKYSVTTEFLMKREA